MKLKKVISLSTAVSLGLSMFSQLYVSADAADGETYTCNFMQLVDSGADTQYGNAENIIPLDDYTTAYLTYEGTYVSADGAVHLRGKTPTNDKSDYTNGSYIAFTAPSDGNVTMKGSAIGFYLDDQYQSYGSSKTFDISKGQTLYGGYRSTSSYISELTFVPAPQETPTATPDIGSEPEREVLYEENFESYQDGENGGWTTPAGKVSVKTDSNSGINKYLAATSNKSGTARSSYKEIPAVTDSFVLEADIKSSSFSTNVSAFEMLENRSSLYMNHGCYSNAKYAFKMNRPAGLNQYVINNKVSDSGLSLDKYDQPAVLTDEIPDDWLHLKVIGDYDSKTATAYLTSLDRSEVFYHGRTDMSEDINSFALLALLAPSNSNDTCIDNIKISKALESDLSEVFYTVTINDGISEFAQYVYDGESAVNIPDMTIYGDYFLGWNVNGEIKTPQELSALPIKSDTSVTAMISPDYIESLADVEFSSFPADNKLVMGADENTYGDNEISLKITGERGTSLVTNPDSRVQDYTINWTFTGFRSLNGVPTGDTGFVYCDSYALCEVTEPAQSSVNFKLKNTSANYYGIVSAEVTYNQKTITVSQPLMLLADTNQDSSVILPKAGYVSDYNKYEDGLIGYTISQNDALTGGWSTAGSDVSHVALASDNSGKYLSITRELSGNSSYTYNSIGDITSQTMFEQDIRFGIDTTISYLGGSDVTKSNNNAFDFAFSDSSFKLNGTEICGGEKGKWYHIVICADPTTRLCWAKIYDIDADGDYSDKTPIGQSALVSFMDSYTSGAYYRISLSKDRYNSVDFNNVKITQAQTDASTINISAPESLSIPESGEVYENLSVSAKTNFGDNAIGLASWEIDDEFAEGVSIESSGAQSAKLTVSSGASSGTLPIKVTLGGASKTININLTGTKDSISFTQAARGIMIPADGNESYTYIAEVKNGLGETISGRQISYKIYDADNTSELDNDEIHMSADGVLTVSSSALPQTVYIRAISSDADENEISKTIKVNIYSLKFSFGTNTTESGFTAVSSADEYSESLGYGITGTASDNAGNISGSGFGFKVRLTPGEVYSVTAVYEGSIQCERIDSSLSGFVRSKSSLDTDTYSTAVFGDGVLDITFSGEGTLSSISIEKTERTPNDKPAWWTIGDSTIQQSGSWAYTLKDSLDKYPLLSGTISAFYNSGQAGRQHRSYYTEGLLNNVLCGIKPGDVVSISGMGTNDSGKDKEYFKNYDNVYIDAIEDMGAYVILGSYTPSGNYGATQGKVYDSDKVLFKGLRTDPYDTAIREVYAERTAMGDDKILGFIDIGQIADNLMTNDVRTAYNAVIDAGQSAADARAAADTRAAELMSMWKDYNHYYTDFSNYILPTLTVHAAQLISGEKQDDVPAVIELKTSGSSNPTVTPTAAPTATPTAAPTTAPTQTPSPTASPNVPTQKPASSPTASPEIISTEKPETYNINIISKSIDDDKVTITIDKGFKGTAIAAMYDKNGALKQMFTQADNSAPHAFEFTRPENTDGYVIKLMSWNSLQDMTPIDIPQAIAVSAVETPQTPAVSPSLAPTPTATPLSTPTAAPTATPTAMPTATPSVSLEQIEVTSSEEYIDVSSLIMYDNTSYVMYKSDGSTETVTADNGKVHNTTGREVTIVPDYKFEFTNQTNPTDEHIKGYVKVGQNSYTKEKGYGLTDADYSINANGCRPVEGRPIKADVPDGFYNITVYRVGGVRADVYSGGVQIIQNTTSSGSQNRPSGSGVMYAPNVKIENGSADITFGNTSGNNERIASVEIVRVPDKYRKPVIYIAGDSESANYYPINADGDDLDSSKIMMTGFGMQIGRFLSDKYEIANWGQPSATAKTWSSESLESISKLMQSGDTLLIDFGINDAVSSTNKVDAETAKANIKEIADAAISAGAKPIIISPVYNSKYQHRTYFTYNKASDTNELAEYAEEIGVDFIDLNRHTMLYTEQAMTDTADESWIANNYHVGDNLHMTQHSALLCASLICAEMKKLGYETTDYSYVYKDLKSLGEDGISRGEESGVTRIYSVEEAEKFIAASASPEEIYSRVWDFETDQTAASGNNVPVISGSASYSSENQNIKFAAETSETGTLSLTLDPAVKSDIIKVAFDLNIGALGGQIFSYNITDNEGTSLVDAQIDGYNSLGSVNVSNENIADNESISISTSRGDGMSAAKTQIINEIDFTNNTVKITIGSTVFTGSLSGSETGTVSSVVLSSSRSKTAGRSIYLDNLSVKGYKSNSSGSETETQFPDFESAVYASEDGALSMPYRYRIPADYADTLEYPVVMYLHGETRRGSDNESQLYNAQYMFSELTEAESCILIAPQCPEDDLWSAPDGDTTQSAQLAKAIIDELSAAYSVDSDRIYIAGYDDGADGCYDLISAYPDVFAASVPTAGSGDISKAASIAASNTSVMAVNGSEDETNSREMIKAITDAGSPNAQYCELYGESHNVSQTAAETEGLIEWLLAQSLTLNIEQPQKVVDLAIFMGQSNMAGRGEYEDAIVCPIGHGYEFRSVTEPDMLFNITGPFGKNENNDAVNDAGSNGIDRRSGDMVSSLMESYYSQTGIPIVGVQCSRGGTNLGYWNSAAQKAEAQSRLSTAKDYLTDKGYVINHIFMVWVQGEADADKIYSGSQSVDGYKSGTLSVFDYMKDAGVEDMFIVQTGHYNGDDDTDGAHDAAYVAVHDAQAALADENDNVYVVGSLLEYKDSMKDSYHFHQNAYNEVGTAAGAAIADIYSQGSEE